MHSLTLQFIAVSLVVVLSIAESEAQQGTGLLVLGGQRFDTATGKFVPNNSIEIVDGKFTQFDTGSTSLVLKKLTLKADQFILPGLIDLHAHYNVRLLKNAEKNLQSCQLSIWQTARL